MKEAREELETVFQGLAMNANLSRGEKSDLFDIASAKYQESILYAVTLSASFEDLARKVGAESATAQMLVQNHAELDYALVSRRAYELSVRFEELLRQVKVDSQISEWMTPQWDGLTREVLLCPHPTLVPLVVEAMNRSVRPSQIEDLIEVFQRALEWNPKSIDNVDMEGLCKRFSDIAARREPLMEYAATHAQVLLERYENGCLLLSPFDGKVSHPLVQIGEALFPHAPPSDLIHLLSVVYPNRHAIWNSIPSGAGYEKLCAGDGPEKIPLSLALAEHSSQEHDVVWSVQFLGDCAQSGALSDSHLVSLRRILPHFPPVEKVTWYSDISKRMYREALTILAETAGIECPGSNAH